MSLLLLILMSELMDFPLHCSQQFIQRSGVGSLQRIKCPRNPIHESTGDRKNGNTSVPAKINSHPPIIDPNVSANVNDKAFASIGNGIHENSIVNDFPTHHSEQFIRGTGQGFQPAINCTRIPNHESTGAHNNGYTAVSAKISSGPQNSKEAYDFLHGLQMNKQILVLDTPLVMCQGNRMFHDFASMPANAPMMNKKSKVEATANQRCNGGNHLLENPFFGKEAVAQPILQVANLARQVIDLTDNSPKSIEIRDRIRTGSGQRFPITEEEVRYYNVICGLAHSQWSGHKAVEFSLLTSVTYSSLGESVEPGGKVDNFFVAGMCRYFFEHRSLYMHNCSHDISNVQKSFLGANSAHKIHLSEKLCFPIVYVFLDSYYDANADFQVQARSKLINAFKECWYQYAEGCTSLEDFTFSYPPVPKQKNVVDCDIFAVKFMELWDNNIDLTNVFDQSDIPNIRVQLAVNMFFSTANSIDKSVVINLCQQTPTTFPGASQSCAFLP